MAVQVSISQITGATEPYDIYICQSAGTNCFYITTINDSQLPYVFDIPVPYDTSVSYMLKVIDNLGCTATGIDSV